jgi:hypothetical protein
MNNPPKEKDFIEAYQEGYEKGHKELKDLYVKKGYEAAFSLVEYKEPDLKNEKFIDWYKEGFESNKEVVKIRDAALAQGKDGAELSIPEEYKKGEGVYKFYYEQGFEEYEAEKEADQQTTAGGLGIAALAWLGRRFYVAKKMIG